MNKTSPFITLLITALAAALTAGIYFSGKPTGETAEDKPQKTEAENFKHEIGELAEGGIIFYLWKDSTGAEHGLVASLNDINKPQPHEKIGANLIGLKAEFPVSGLLKESSASQCNFYSGGGYFDWYLPAAWEMFELFNQGLIINNVLGKDEDDNTCGLTFFSSHYWTMPTANSGNAWDACFFSDFGTGYSKDYVGKVRAVRRF